MNLQLVRMYGVLIAGLAVMGLFTNGRLFELMNVDPALDVLRGILALYLLYVGFMAKGVDMVNGALLAVGLLYVGMGIVGLFNPTLVGLLPTGLTGFDIAFHLITGGVALFVSLHKTKSVAAHA